MSAVQVTGLTVCYGPPGTAPAVDNVDLSAEAVTRHPDQGAGGDSPPRQVAGFGDLLASRVAERASQIVLGLDPDPARLWPRAVELADRTADPPAALRVRMLDRVFDNYVMTPMQKPESEALRGEGATRRTDWPSSCRIPVPALMRWVVLAVRSAMAQMESFPQVLCP